ncbi:MAG: hypothetical protein UY23_C0001G0381 [Candidatus Jorgensenbacteria bacterium GW2011_GWA1_48_11]|uniref:Serine hydrolase family protein n=1 Tax=Candidatus Jorgensenbacteria bacterium GW2011_GWA1_48_11 TaxID=1618660 RepID=A0A0G1XBU5_9BACT|nr:MAG: hypothetical protein UY23_C0001G0381 [Candidatus Jorgensenbacteria bacterium GW2011_GWA1_48_11]KKW12266.1 MAG: hypothetical protein UY51_C0005G0508 [Candidatus Jorgensenbacteria bacterium GW2011_GWB1_49_9]
MRRVFLIHGWMGSPHGDWLPWLKRELEKKGFDAFAPHMPEPAKPEIKSWISQIDGAVGLPDAETYFVGHSVGCQAVLRYLAATGGEIGGAVLIAPWFSLAAGALETAEDEAIAEPWLKTPIDFEKIREATGKFTAIFSDNDPWVDWQENSEIVKEKLGAKTVILHEQGHFSEMVGGVLELPVVLAEILKIAGRV